MCVNLVKVRDNMVPQHWAFRSNFSKKHPIKMAKNLNKSSNCQKICPNLNEKIGNV